MSSFKNSLRMITFFLLGILVFSISYKENVYALGKHGLSIEVYKCNTKDESTFDPYTCYDSYYAGDLDTFHVNDGGNIEAGDILLIIPYYTLGTPSTVTSFQAIINYDPTKFTVIADPDSPNKMFKYFDEETYPYVVENRKKKYNWSLEINNIPSLGEISMVADDVTSFKELTESLNVVYFALKVADDVPANSTVTLSYSSKPGEVFFADKSSNRLDYETKDISMTIYGDSETGMSDDNTLGSLTVTNGSTNYPLDPTFVAGDPNTKEYSTVVPPEVSSVTITATKHNEYATVLPGNLENQTLTVGDNTISFIVQAQNGTPETYKIHIYRLSGDATLSSLALSNNINIGTFHSTTYTYHINNIPYATKNTTITAIPTHKNAYLDNFTAEWTLANSGSTLNTKTILVKAENCLDEYKNVPGNLCKEQSYTIHVSRLAPSNNNNLATLTVDNQTLSPGLDAGTTSYHVGPVSNDTESIYIRATVEDTEKATIVGGTGNCNLNVGDNTCTVTVKAENGDEKPYVIHVKRLSSEIKLSSLTVSSNPIGTLSPSFIETFTGEYTYTYGPSVTSVVVSATVKDTNKAKVAIADISTNPNPTVTGTLNTVSATFSNTVTKVVVIVTAEDGTIETYPIQLSRLQSSDNTLSSLKVNGISVTNFQPGTQVYHETVVGTIDKVSISATVTDTGRATILTDLSQEFILNFGQNQIDIEVEAEDGGTKKYTVFITRNKKTDATLQDLTVNGKTVTDFDGQNKFEYTLNDVPYNTTSLNIDAVASDNNPIGDCAEVVGTGNILLHTGLNTISLTVTAHDGVTKKNYTIYVTRTLNNDKGIEKVTLAGVEAVKNVTTGNYEVTVPNAITEANQSNTIVTVNEPLLATDTKATYMVQTTTLSTQTPTTVPITVRAEDGTTTTYNLVVTRTKSAENLLSRVNLTIGNDSSRYCMVSGSGCSIHVPVDTTNFTLEAIISQNATVTPKNGISYTMATNESTKTITLTVTSEDGTPQPYIITVERQKSSNNDLSDLKLNNKTVTNFHAGTQVYHETVSGTMSEVTISATVLDTGKAKILTDLSNSFPLNFGSNQIDIEVEAESGDKKTYTIFVTREKKTDATLQDLTVNGVTVTDFNGQNKFEYTLSDVSYNTTSLNIGAIASDNTPAGDCASITGVGPISLHTGLNTITVTVTAHDGVTTQDYVIKVTRNQNNDTGIENITLAGIKAVKNGVTGKYEVTVPNNIEEAKKENTIVTVNHPLLETDTKATYFVPTTALSTQAPTTVKITVTAEDGTADTYDLVVTRTKSNLNELTRVNLTVGDDSSRYCMISEGKCTINVPVDTTNFTLEAIISQNATVIPKNGTSYTMAANESTKEVTLTVTAEDGTTKDYTITVERQRSSNNDLSNLKLNNKSVTNFHASTQIYHETVSGTTEEVIVSATVLDTGKATILTDLSSPFPLDFGSNQIDIEVEAESGDKKTYTIFVTREKKTDATLQDLTVNGKTVTDFDGQNKFEYTLNDVPYNTTSLNIGAIASDNTPALDCASVTGTGLTTLHTGLNTITITVTAHDGVTTQDYVIKVTRTKNHDTGIERINLAGIEATKNVTTGKYEVTVPNSITEANSTNTIVTVNSPRLETDSKATYLVESKNLSTENKTTVIIAVTAEDGTTHHYDLVVTREKANIATLDSITVTDGSFKPSFKPGTFQYQVIVPVTATEFDVSAVKTDPKSKITSGIGHYPMNNSSETVEIVVVSEDTQVTNTYTLEIVRTESSINTLSDITVSSGTLSPEFAPDTTNYTVNVSGDVDNIDIDATLSDKRATIVSGTGNHKLEVGENQITVRVKSESGSILDYTIKVVRASKFDNNLTDLTVDGITVPGFHSDITEYTLDPVIYNKTNIVIGATTSDIDAKVTGTGKKSLKTGDNTFEVVVEAQDGTPKTYTIYVKRTKNDNANLSLLSVNGYPLTPSFEKTTTDYEIAVVAIKDTLSPGDVTAIPEDSNATIAKQEEISLSTTLDNYYEVVVTAEDGTTTKTYTIKVIRPKSNDATLKDIELTGATLSPKFQNGKFEYTITVPHGETTFTINGIPNVGTTKVFGNGEHSIESGVMQLTTQAEDGTIEIYRFTLVETPSNDASLSSLSVTGYTFGKPFVETTLDYGIGNIPYSTKKLQINAVASNVNATIEYYVDGLKQSSNIVNIPQALGTKTIEVKVLAADGVTDRTYRISYTVVNSDNSYLSNIIPSSGTLDFHKATTYYELNVLNNVTSIDFTVTTEDSNAKITVNGEDFFTPKVISLADLKEGNNTLEILVTAQNGTSTRTYNIVVFRAGLASDSDANLSNLEVKGYPLDQTFKMDTTEYDIGEIPFSETELEIEAIANVGSSKLTYLVNGIKQTSNQVKIPKTEGEGTITIQVLAVDGTTKDYKITYSKKASNNAYLSNIEVSSGTLAFHKETFHYEVEVDSSVTSIDIKATTEDSNATMKMNNKEYLSPHTLTLNPLVDGDNEVVIVVTAENKNSFTYKVVIKKASDEIPDKITSIEYGHTIDGDYIRTVKLDTTVSEMKDQLDNENEYLEIWNADDDQKLSEDEKLATGMIVKLIINGEEKDRKLVVIKGDTSGDGEIDLFDAVRILNDYLVRTPLTGAYKEAAYVNDDEDIDLFDSVMILNHYLGRTMIH